MKKMRVLLSGLVIVSAMGFGQLAHAHKVNLFAYAEGGEVSVEGYFVDGKKAQNSTVMVYNDKGDLLVEGETNSEGMFLFPVPEKSDLRIVLNAGMGHQSEFTLAADELEEVGASVADVLFHQPESTSIVADVNEPEAVAPRHEVTAASSAVNADVETLVRHAVSEAIKPLVRELAESREHASLSSLVGGVGYIVGFLGLFAFFKARQMSAESPDKSGS